MNNFYCDHDGLAFWKSANDSSARSRCKQRMLGYLFILCPRLPTFNPRDPLCSIHTRKSRRMLSPPPFIKQYEQCIFPSALLRGASHSGGGTVHYKSVWSSFFLLSVMVSSASAKSLSENWKLYKRNVMTEDLLKKAFKW